MGGNFNFVSPSGFKTQSDFDYRISKIKFCSVRALKCYLNEKNLINGRVTATISKFSPQIFETYFNFVISEMYCNPPCRCLMKNSELIFDSGM